ncbi:MAG: T9SS type A sorting domain-containing protein [Bacteroidota bacterium]|nr:T9SS type A sorting domain-containing protein [Bacteroidota bacterium]MDP4230806.1 T9SS type A sorting domain-containing protein [Bacteroidota bacterium]MDP4235318.1 T9SS type A sorting domain-containing protein [Bacteroidota bacterium]
MYRIITGISLYLAIICCAGSLFAQETGDDQSNLGYRAAKSMQSPADTGIQYDEYRLEKASHDYYNAARFSGTNAGKTMHEIEIESYDAMRHMQNQASFKSQSNPAWVPIGGSQDGHASGRVRGIAFDPTNPNIVYVAAASGGVWKTMDITAQPVQWVNLSDRLPTVNFGSIAVDPKRPNVVYAGTGESQGDNYMEPPGSGLFKSNDGGLNWYTSASTTLAGSVCSQIVIDPVNTDVIYIATGNSWILKSVDSGATWKKITTKFAPLSIAIDPQNTNNLYISGFGNIYRSVDNGETWTKSSTGLPTASVGRITVAVAPSSPNIIYASIGNSSNRQALGLWVSTDFGVTWTRNNAGSPNFLGSQQEWCNSLAVHPTNPNRIFVGGLDIYSSNNSGKDFSRASVWTDPVTSTSFVHADIHFLVFSGNTLYACTDGGIAKSGVNQFSIWNTAINQGLATLQFVGVDANHEFSYVTGGCQDNSTNRDTIRGDVPGPEFHATAGGDGGHAWVSQEQGNIAYTTYVYTDFKQSLDSGQHWSQNLITCQNNPGLYNVADGSCSGEGSPFYTVYDCSSDGTIVALGGNSHVWVSSSGGQDGFPGKSNVGIGGSYAINVSQQDPSFMWAGSGANIYRTVDQGGTWAKQTTPASLSSTISGIATNPNNTTEVYACATSGKHFFKSTDGGVTYTSPATNLPNVPCWSIAFNPKDGKLFMGTEKGVLFSADGGVTWNPLMNGFPYVLVTQLRVRGTNSDRLLAGTYGRGMFFLDISNLSSVNPQAPASLSLDPIYPNPLSAANATLAFSLNDPGIATITLHDLLGRELRILAKSYYDAGKHQIAFAKENIAAGTYFVMLTANGRSVSQKIVIE